MKKAIFLVTIFSAMALSSSLCSANNAIPEKRHTISAGHNHAAAIDNNGDLWMWGNNDNHQLGMRGGNLVATGLVVNGYACRQTVPKKITSDVVDVCASLERTYFLKKDGTLWTTNWDISLPAAPTKILDDIMFLGERTAIKRDNSLWMLGKTPIKIMDNVVAATNNSSSTVAIKTDNSLWAWGSPFTKYSAYGCIGNGTLGPSDIPVKILDDVAEAVPGYALKKDGTLWAWGQFNAFGIDLSDNILYREYTFPTQIMDNVSSFSYGFTVCAAIKNDGSLWMWGDNTNGSIGSNGSYTHTAQIKYHNIQAEPIKVMDNVLAVDIGQEYTIALKTDGTLWSWGLNDTGQLGNGTTTDSFVPVQIMDNVSTETDSIIHSVYITINENPLDCKQSPYIKDGKTLVPLRSIFEALNATVNWDEETRTITAKKGSKTISMSIGQNVMYVNNNPKALDVPPEIKNSSTFIPVRAISEALGCKVNWNAETRTVIIKDK